MARRLILLRHRIIPIFTSPPAKTIPPTKATHLPSSIHFYTPYSTKSPPPDKPVTQNRISDDYGDKSDNALLENDVGRNLSRKDKVQFLINTLLDLKDSKEAVYGALDAWVAWEQKFPIASLRIALTTLEKQQEWHKVIQVIKWILSKGQGNTMGIYRQLITALDKDDRVEEAHYFWMKRIGSDLHPVPWQICTLMISIYYRNNMLERLVKLFKGLEAFDRKPPDKAVVQKVADAYELLGLVEEKNRVLEKYKSLFTETWRGHPKNSKKALQKKAKKPADGKQIRALHSEQSDTYDAQMASSDQKITMESIR